MAQTFTALYPGVTFAAGKVLAGILNAHATEVLKIRRVGLVNMQPSAVAGVICAIELRKYTDTAELSGGSTVTPVAHDSANTAAASAVFSFNSTPSGTSNLLRRIWWSSDEPSVGTGTVDELECNIPLNIVWDAGYGESDVQPLTLRQDESMVVYNVSGTVGAIDVWIEFTKE